MIQQDTGGARHMEFYGRQFFVKKVSCFPGDIHFLPSVALPQDKVVAVASNNVHHMQTTRNEEHFVLEQYRRVMALLQPSPEVATLMAAFDKRLAAHGSLQYLAAHWRRGDRALPDMGAFAKQDWARSYPAHFACLISEMVKQTGLTLVLVMTNAGRESDRHALRYYVKRWSGADVVFFQDLIDASKSAKFEFEDQEGWARELIQLVAEVLLCGRPAAVGFLSDGVNFQVSSLVSRLVHVMRAIHGHNVSTTYFSPLSDRGAQGWGLQGCSACTTLESCTTLLSASEKSDSSSANTTDDVSEGGSDGSTTNLVATKMLGSLPHGTTAGPRQALSAWDSADVAHRREMVQQFTAQGCGTSGAQGSTMREFRDELPRRAFSRPLGEIDLVYFLRREFELFGCRLPGIAVDPETGVLQLPREVKRIKIDVGLAFNAPNSQIWFQRSRGSAGEVGGGLDGGEAVGGEERWEGRGGGELLVFGVEPNLEAVGELISGRNRRRGSGHVYLDPAHVGVRWFLLPLALGSSSRLQTLYATSVDPGMSSLHKPDGSYEPATHYSTYSVPVVRLADLFALLPWGDEEETGRVAVVEHLKIDAQVFRV
jgi:hypothetical protein